MRAVSVYPSRCIWYHSPSPCTPAPTLVSSSHQSRGTASWESHKISLKTTRSAEGKFMRPIYFNHNSLGEAFQCNLCYCVLNWLLDPRPSGERKDIKFLLFWAIRGTLSCSVVEIEALWCVIISEKCMARFSSDWTIHLVYYRLIHSSRKTVYVTVSLVISGSCARQNRCKQQRGFIDASWSKINDHLKVKCALPDAQIGHFTSKLVKTGLAARPELWLSTWLSPKQQ